MSVISELVALLGFEVTGEKELKKFQKGLKSVEKGVGRVSGAASGAARLLKGLFIGIGAKKAIDEITGFEDGIADINKVMDITPKQLATISEDLLNLSKTIPVTAQGLAAIAAEGAATGKEFEDLAAFTELVAKGVVALDVPAERLGENLAKIGSVLGLSQKDLEKFLDTTNELSNNLSAKGGEIINFVRRATGAALQLGLSVDEMAAIGAAFVNAGVVPETAARGFEKFATQIQVPTKQVSAAFQALGMDRKQFLLDLQRDGPKALDEFFKLIGKSKDSAAILKSLVGLDFSDDFAKLVKGKVSFGDAFDIKDSIKVSGSLLKEFETRMSTSSARFDLMFNNLKAKLIEFGGDMVKGMGKAALAIAQFLADAEKMKQVGEFFKPITSAFEGFGDNITFVYEAFKELVGIESQLKGLGVAIGILLAVLFPWVTVFVAAAAAFNDFINFIRGKDSVIGDFVAGVTEFLVPFQEDFDKVFKAIGDIVDFFVERFAPIGESIGSTFSRVGEQLGKLSTVFDGFEGSGEKFEWLDMLIKFLTALTKLGIEVIATGLELLGTTIGVLAQALGSLLEGDLSGVLITLGRGLMELAEILVGGILGSLEQLIHLFSSFFNFDPSGFIDGIVAMFKALPGALDAAFTEFSAFMRVRAADMASDFVAGILDTIPDGIKELLGLSGSVETSSETPGGVVNQPSATVGGATSEATPVSETDQVAAQNALAVLSGTAIPEQTVATKELTKSLGLMANLSNWFGGGANNDNLEGGVSGAVNSNNQTSQTNNNTVTINQTVTGDTAAGAAASGVTQALKRGNDRNLAADNAIASGA